MSPTLRVLVVDDERPAADAIGQTLRDEGYEVSVAYDCGTAMSAAAERLPDALVADHSLEDDLDGVELARRLRTHNPRLHVALMFGAMRPEATSALRGLDCVVLQKPIDLEEMLASLPRAR